MTTSERIEANANLVKWCVHILGPDDVVAAPSYHQAAIHAHELNKIVFGRVSTHDDVLCFAYAAPWPHNKESHDEAVKDWLNNVS